MFAAIYARKSTDQHGVSDDQKSVTRQIEHARGYAPRKGWSVAEEHIYSDDGISGAEFVKRPGFIRLMSVLKPKPPFQILIMSEESRLGREQIKTAYALQQSSDTTTWTLQERYRTPMEARNGPMWSYESTRGRPRSFPRSSDYMWRARASRALPRRSTPREQSASSPPLSEEASRLGEFLGPSNHSAPPLHGGAGLGTHKEADNVWCQKIPATTGT